MPKSSIAHAAPSLGELLAYADRCRSEGRLVEAETACLQILEASPAQGDAEHQLGLIAHQRGKLAEAVDRLRQAVAHAPQNALYRANLTEMLRQAGRFKAAVEQGRRAVEANPNLTIAWSNLGAALFELKEYDESAEAHRRALAIDECFAQGHCSLGNALHGLKRYDEAIACYRRTVALAPRHIDGWANLSTSLHHAGRYGEAMAAARLAIALNPDHGNARSGLGMLLLMRGEFAEGFAEYEWRLRSSERKGPRFPERPWRGESLSNKHIYVQAEQGFGDTLQFSRYVPLLTRFAGKVSFRVHQQLVGLLRESLPGVEVLGDRGEPGAYDCDVALMSLPHLFSTRYETIPADMPALRAPAEAVARWRPRLAGMKGLKVGLIWAGNPEHTNDLRRSLDLKHLEPLLDVPGVSFASLQFGPRAADVKKLGSRARILDLSRELGDFADTAGAVMGLDLVISIDSSGAHLAGGLGKPVWLLTSWVADWRWRLEGEDNAWYPNARLFRQAEGEEWAAVIARVRTALAAAAAGEAGELTPFLTAGRERARHAAEILAIQIETALRPPPAPEPVSVGHLLAMAEQKRRHRLLADAQELCQRAAEINPGNAETAHALGIIAHESGRLAEAIDHLRHAVELAPRQSLYRANLGEMLRLAGRFEEALAEGLRALDADPENVGAMSNVAIALYDLKRYEEGLPHLDRALALRPDFAIAHSNRGNALQKLKRYAEAEAAYRRALQLQPTNPDPWNNLGTCLRELKRPEEAEAAYREALKVKPNDPDILDSLALALKDLDRHEEAEAAFRAALAIETRTPKFYVHFGALLADRRREAEAEQMARRALALDAQDPDALNLMGRAVLGLEQPERALQYFHEALALEPDLADAYNNLGNALKELGRLDEALEAYEKALAIDPDAAGVYVNLADSLRFKSNSPYLEHMETLAARPAGLTATDRMHLDFALGKAYADLGRYEESFDRLVAANAAKRRLVSYDEREAFAFFDRIERVFTRQLIAQKSGGGDRSERPIFIVGMPRSGTTLVEQILASHPMTHGAGELMTLFSVVEGAKVYPEMLAQIDSAGLGALGARYLDAIRAIAPEGVRVTDKMPSNYYYLGLIHLALPNARIIHTSRDPIDNCMSCFSKLFTAEQNHTYDLGELGRYYRRYAHLMAHWREVLPAGAFLDVRYEDVVEDVQAEARRILAYCGLPWDARCLDFHATERPVRTASATQVRQPIYRSAIGRWRPYEARLQSLLTALQGDDLALP